VVGIEVEADAGTEFYRYAGSGSYIHLRPRSPVSFSIVAELRNWFFQRSLLIFSTRSPTTE
jgi:hypothetical protein